jgi:hypothetical protein
MYLSESQRSLNGATVMKKRRLLQIKEQLDGERIVSHKQQLMSSSSKFNKVKNN